MKKILYALSAVLVVVVGATGCYYDNSEDLYPANTGGACDTAGVTYTAQLKQVVDNQCATSDCHAALLPSGWDLSNYEGLKQCAMSGTLIPSIEHTSNNPMPKDGTKLDACTISKFKAWINAGMPE